MASIRTSSASRSRLDREGRDEQAVHRGPVHHRRGHRSPIGVYHHASPKHLGRYVDEFAFRLNEGNVAHHTLARLGSFIDGVAGKRLTYKALIA